MKRVIILHGKPSKQRFYDMTIPNESNANWLLWLQSQLLKRDVMAYTPDMPKAYAPDWQLWCREVERYPIDEDTALVGHSCGGGFWVRYLSEHPDLRVGKVILVAPWLDPDGDETGDFFRFEIDPRLAERTKELIVYNSDNDMGNVHKSVATLREYISTLQYKEFHKHGHFDEEGMGTREFPELLEELLPESAQ